MSFTKKIPIKKIITVVVIAVVLAVFIVGDVLCSKYEYVITKLLCNTGIDFSDGATQETLENNDKVVERLSEEGIVMLKNDNGTLPLSEKENKINLFGWSAHDGAFLLTGGGSAVATINVDKKVTLAAGLKSEGFEVNETLLADYAAYCGSRNKGNLGLYEPDVSFYQKKGSDGKTRLEYAKEFSSVALVVFSRYGSEGLDLPFTQTKYIDGNKTEDKTRTYLDLSKEEEDMLNMVADNFAKVIVIVNSGNTMNLSFLKNEKIGAAFNISYPGQSGTKAIARILKGSVNPSGRTSDTYATDLKKDPSYVNAVMTQTSSGKNIHYTENIYIGYKWYETADKEGYFEASGTSYDNSVVYPFGHGLSYTTFEKEILSYTLSTDGLGLQRATTVEVAVAVTNTGSVKGKDVIELYYTPPYTSGGIEKAHVNLLAFEKTGEIEPGKTENYKLTFTSYDMASYDCYDRNKNGRTGWELESGLYKVQLLENAHSWKNLTESNENTIEFNVENTIAYKRDPKTGGMVKNRYGTFDEAGNYIKGSAYGDVPIDGSTAGEEIKWLSRSNFKDTFPTTVTPIRDISSEVSKANSYVHNAPYEKITEEPTQGVAGELTITLTEDGKKPSKDALKSGSGLKFNDELVMKLGANYNDETWELLLNQLTKDELLYFVESSGYATDEAASIGKPFMNELDGGSGFNVAVNNPISNNANKWTGFSNATLWAQTWNKNIAFILGEAIGQEGQATGISAIYAPTVNLHRSAFNGRNFEAFSEDAVLSGTLAANVIKGAKSKGLRMYLKHLVLSEEGPNPSQLNVWITEQNLRENYLKSFEIAVKEGGANSVMSSFNRLGGTWTGGNYALLTNILRNEWGFKGAIITDWCVGDNDMTVERGIRAGNDIWLSPQDRCNNGLDESSASSWYCARRSGKNLLYAICETYHFAKTYDPTADIGIGKIADVFRWWIPVLVLLNVTVLAACGFSVYLVFFKKKKVVISAVSSEESSSYTAVPISSTKSFEETSATSESAVTAMDEAAEKTGNELLEKDKTEELSVETKTALPFTRKTIKEAYEAMSYEQKIYFNSIKAYALSKDVRTKVVASEFQSSVKIGTHLIVTLKIKKGFTYAYFNIENAALKHYRKYNAGSGIRVRETVLKITDKLAYMTAIDLIDETIENYNAQKLLRVPIGKGMLAKGRERFSESYDTIILGKLPREEKD